MPQHKGMKSHMSKVGVLVLERSTPSLLFRWFMFHSHISIQCILRGEIIKGHKISFEQETQQALFICCPPQMKSLVSKLTFRKSLGVLIYISLKPERT